MRNQILKNIKFRILLAFVLIALSAELSFRILGFDDFPLYHKSSIYGYFPNHGQSGSFLNRNRWSINEFGMQAENYSGSPSDVILIGDSLVWGGNSYDQEEKLGYLLEVEIKKPVWSVAAGSWGLRNALLWLTENHAKVDAPKTIVFLLNSGDFDAASVWKCETTHPTKKPISIIWYMFNKHFFNLCNFNNRSKDEFSAINGIWKDDIANLGRLGFLKGKRLVFLFYPNKLEFLGGLNFSSIVGDDVVTVLRTYGEFHEVNANYLWSLDYYKDAVHPTVEGNFQLSKIISQILLVRD